MFKHQMMFNQRGARCVAMAAAALTAACGGAPDSKSGETARPNVAGVVYTVHDTTLEATFEAAGVAGPLQQATLSTKLMGTVAAVLVREGDHVAGGETLLRIDARDLAAKAAQATAAIAEAEAMHNDAVTQANRIRALYSDSAATRAQLDVVETGLARAQARVRAAHAARAELDAVSSYAVVQAPFAGVVTKRFVDPGAFAAPGAPLVTVQDASQLRITVNATPDIARTLRRGQPIAATIEGQPVHATIEGVVPAAAGNLSTVNALVSNRARVMLAGSAASLVLPIGMRKALVVPAAAITREGDLAGITLRTAQGDVRRWVRLGRASGDMIEVSGGLRPGDHVVIPRSRVVIEEN